mgnify:CR=1 FL=1
MKATVAVAAAAGCAGMISEREYGFAAAFAVLFVVSLAPFLTELMGRGKLKFSEEESGFRAAHLDTLPGRDVRLLLDQGNWLNLQPGEVLTREGEAVSGVFFLAEGSAAVTVGGADVGTIDKGNLIGEAGSLDDEPATATVTVTEPARLWFMLAPSIRSFAAMHPQVAVSLRKSFAHSVRAKLAASNERAAKGS